MNEVEKMYSNAHVYPRVYGDITKETFENKVLNMADMCNEAFTAEKQIELIKWLSKKQYMYIIMSADKEYYLCTDNSFISGYNKQFDKALAMFTNAYWQSLTDAERTQIKEILE